MRKSYVRGEARCTLRRSRFATVPPISAPSRENKTGASAEFEELLTYAQLGERLKLKRSALNNLVARRAIPVIRISGRCVRFRWSEVEAALKKLTIREVR